MNDKPILVASNLGKRFPLSRKQQKERRTSQAFLQAVHNLSFELYQGEIFALLGPNGAGKTTTLRMLSGLLSPSEGEISLLGEKLDRKADSLRSHIGFLTSELKLDNFFTPDYTFAFMGRLYGLSDETIAKRKEELFYLFGVKDFAFAKIGELSTGMKQKVSLSVSLVNDPDLVIFDEPTNGLDILASKAVEDYLLKLRRDGKAIIISTHIFSLVEKLADKALIILNGEKAYEDSMANIAKAGGIEKVFFSVYQEEKE